MLVVVELPNKLTEGLKHVIGPLLLAVTFCGLGNTFTITVSVSAAQTPFTPITEYVVVIVGETATVAPVKLPGIQVYVNAPDELNVVESPLQIILGEAAAVTVGLVYTTIVTVVEPVHPNVLVPVTVYIVVDVGLMITTEPVAGIGLQV